MQKKEISELITILYLPLHIFNFFLLYTHQTFIIVTHVHIYYIKFTYEKGFFFKNITIEKIHEDMTELLQSAVELRILFLFSCWGKFTEVDINK